MKTRILEGRNEIFYLTMHSADFIYSYVCWTYSKSQSWEFGSPPIGGAGKMKLSCVVPASVLHI